jgi:hypothetical protein
MIEKLNKISTFQAATLLLILGLCVFYTGLHGPFRDDDMTQIVNNVPVHSITHIRTFFEGGTFDYGQGLSSPLQGPYYKPLMTTVFSLIYTFFGPQPIAFHAAQMLICIASAFLLFLVFRYSFKPILALLLAAIFMVHPLNSQVVYEIATMQDALFFLFGIMAFWFLLKFHSTKGLIPVCICLFLSMLSKETALGFVVMTFAYLYWFNRERLKPFAKMIVIPVGVYLALSINAVGLKTHQNVSPIDSLHLLGRLYTAPSEMLFYFTKFIFPWKLASDYFWVYPHFSIRHVLLPLIADLVIVCGFFYLGIILRRRLSKANFYTYVFFGVWVAVGLLMHLNIVPLDTTASEPWFYFSMAGIFGMIGITLEAFNIQLRWILIAAILVIGLLGFRTAMRGLDWDNETKLSLIDIKVSPDDFQAYNDAAGGLYEEKNYPLAKAYAIRSINIYPTYTAYYNLGLIMAHTNHYAEAESDYEKALQFTQSQLIYTSLCELTVIQGSPSSDAAIFTNALSAYPNDATLWMYLAIVEDEYNDNAKAKTYIEKAATLGQIPASLYNNIIDNNSFKLQIYGLEKGVMIHKST